MARGIIITLLVIAALLVFGLSYMNTAAQEEEGIEGLTQVLKNQKLMLEKLETIDKKLDQLKMRIRQ